MSTEIIQIPTPVASEIPAPKKRFPWIRVFLILLVAGGTIGYVTHRKIGQSGELAAATKDLAVPSVLVARPEHAPVESDLVLPGNVQALREASIYARVNGYLKRWLVDIGTQVKEGQLLAEIETPETDQQLNQALAIQAQAEADLRLAQINADRWNNLVKDHAVPQSDVDQKNGDLEVKKANLEAALANVHRLEQLQSFQKVYAPFDGTITSRKTEVGNLINAGSGAQGAELFHIAQTGSLRVYVDVPEAYSSAVVAGLPATLDLATAPGKAVTGTLVRTAAAIDPASHTMLAEIEVPNKDALLIPGGYAQVHFKIAPENPPLLIPANALIFRSQGSQVAVVGADHQVRLVPIKIGRDFGSKLEVVQGLTEQDSVILNPSDSLGDGTLVRVEDPKLNAQGVAVK
jgi:membrane fusion protein (multidrug efflux system)